MSGHSAYDIEKVLRDSEPMRGVTKEIDLQPLTWRNNDGSALAATGAGIVGYGAVLTNHIGLVWNATADQTDIVRKAINLPGDLCLLDPGVEDAQPNIFKLMVWARKLDTGGAGENADLALRCQAFWQIQGQTTALNTLATPASATLAAMAVAGSEEAFKWYTLDIGAAMTAAQKRAIIAATTDKLGPLQLQLYPHEAVGAALAIEVTGIKLRYTAHATLKTRSSRY